MGQQADGRHIEGVTVGVASALMRSVRSRRAMSYDPLSGSEPSFGFMNRTLQPSARSTIVAECSATDTRVGACRMSAK